MSVHIRSIFSNVIIKTRHTHTLLTCQPLRIPSPSAFFLLMGLALHWSLTAESNHLACFMGVIRLDFTFPFGMCVVCPVYVQARTNSLLHLASLVHLFPTPEGSVSITLSSLAWHSSSLFCVGSRRWFKRIALKLKLPWDAAQQMGVVL